MIDKIKLNHLEIKDETSNIFIFDLINHLYGKHHAAIASKLQVFVQTQSVLYHTVSFTSAE